MKKLIFTLIIITPAIILFSFRVKPTINLNPMAENSETIISNKNLFDWSLWQKVSCYKGIQFRTSRGEFYMGKYSWYVQFRNLYSREVRFGYNIVEPEKEAITRKERNVLDVWRLSAGFNPDEEGNNRDAPHGMNYAISADKVFVYITNAQFSNDGDWNTSFIVCDY